MQQVARFHKGSLAAAQAPPSSCTCNKGLWLRVILALVAVGTLSWWVKQETKVKVTHVTLHDSELSQDSTTRTGETNQKDERSPWEGIRAKAHEFLNTLEWGKSVSLWKQPSKRNAANKLKDFAVRALQNRPETYDPKMQTLAQRLTVKSKASTVERGAIAQFLETNLEGHVPADLITTMAKTAPFTTDDSQAEFSYVESSETGEVHVYAFAFRQSTPDRDHRNVAFMLADAKFKRDLVKGWEYVDGEELKEIRTPGFFWDSVEHKILKTKTKKPIFHESFLTETELKTYQNVLKWEASKLATENLESDAGVEDERPQPEMPLSGSWFWVAVALAGYLVFFGIHFIIERRAAQTTWFQRLKANIWFLGSRNYHYANPIWWWQKMMQLQRTMIWSIAVCPIILHIINYAVWGVWVSLDTPWGFLYYILSAMPQIIQATASFDCAGEQACKTVKISAMLAINLSISLCAAMVVRYMTTRALAEPPQSAEQVAASSPSDRSSVETARSSASACLTPSSDVWSRERALSLFSVETARSSASAALTPISNRLSMTREYVESPEATHKAKDLLQQGLQSIFHLFANLAEACASPSVPLDAGLEPYPEFVLTAPQAFSHMAQESNPPTRTPARRRRWRSGSPPPRRPPTDASEDAAWSILSTHEFANASEEPVPKTAAAWRRRPPRRS